MNKKEKILQAKHRIERKYVTLKKKRNTYRNTAQAKKEEFMYIEPTAFVSDFVYKTYVLRANAQFRDTELVPYIVHIWNTIEFEVIPSYDSCYIREMKKVVEQKSEEINSVIAKERTLLQQYTELAKEEKQFPIESPPNRVSQEFVDYYHSQQRLSLYNDIVSHTEELLSLLQQEYELSS